MRVAQVVSLVSPDGAYGGPVRVAMNQLQKLEEFGHEVRLYATRRGFDSPPTRLLGVPLTTRPARTAVRGTGFAGLWSATLLEVLRRELPLYDLVHVHVCRDLVTLPAARLAMSLGLPVVLQTHGMIDVSSRMLARPLDALMTRPVLSHAARTLYLTEVERASLEAVSRGQANLSHLPNGVPFPALEPKASRSPEMEVLFLARLQARKRPQMFVKAAIHLSAEFPNVRFTLVGPDEGEGKYVEELIRECANSRITWEGPLSPDRTLERMSRSDVYVLPAVQEPFGMTVLEAASCGLPSVVTDSCGLAPAIERWAAGTVVDDELASLTGAIRELLVDGSAREQKARRAIEMVRAEFGIDAVACSLERIYSEVLDQADRSS